MLIISPVSILLWGKKKLLLKQEFIVAKQVDTSKLEKLLYELQ